MRRITKSIILAATIYLLSPGSVFACEEGLPADLVIAAIETAIAANPGLIEEIEVEREDNKLIIEVKIIDADRKKTKVKVDPEKNKVIR